MSFYMKTFHIIAVPILVASLSLSSCTADQPERGDPPGPEVIDPVVPPETDGEYTVLRFEENSGDVTNPERGFYYPYDFKSSSKALTANEVKSKRKAGHTVLMTQYILDKWMSCDIPESFLSLIQANFDALRSGGAKCILRFCYKQNDSESAQPWDAEEKWVMRHIEQLKPLLQKNEDVILVFQAGFVGVWGEWYYTDHFIMDPQTPEDYLPRKRVLEAMLDALPESRQVAVRTPDFKMMMYGLALADTLTAKTAHDGSVISRIGGYNDCFGASEDDYGTYVGADARAFWQGDTRYTFMGGETCGLSDYCHCEVSLSDMEKYHWSYLNIDYNGQVLSRWKTEGCYNEVKRRLGYRLVLESLHYTTDAQAGKVFNLILQLRNDGFSAFQNPRDAHLIFAAEDGTTTTYELAGDPRTWHPGSHRITASFKLPAAKGTLYLHLADPLFPDRPEYSVALANKGVWEAATGYNKLLSIN